MLQQFVVLMAQINIDEAYERRVLKHLTFFHLCTEHLPIIVLRDLADDVAVGRACLEDDLSCRIVASSSSCHLTERLERTFITAEIGQVEHRVGIKNAYDRHTVEIQSFRHHLRTHENICLMG